MSATKAAKITEPGRYAVGDGVQLLIGPSGARSWVLRIMVDGKRRDYGLGGAGVDIATARANAQAIRANGGTKPEPDADAMTFGKVADAYIALHTPTWRSAKHAQQWTSTITTYCAHMLDTPIGDVTKAQVLAALEPHWHTKHESMFRLRGRIRAICEWALARDYRTDDVNPAERLGLPTISRADLVQHHKSLHYTAVPDFLHRLAALPGLAPIALHVAILCASRSGEVRGMEWAEVDLDNALWRVPAARMKGGKRDHIVPLPRQATSLLAALPHRVGLVFPSSKAETPMTDMALLQVVRRMGDPCVPHGFRASFSTWVTEQTDASIELREACLAHASADKVVAAYNRSTFLDKRRALLQSWADMVEPTPCR